MSPLLLCLSALAAEPAEPAEPSRAPLSSVHGSVYGGFGANVNDPFIERRGVQGGFELGPLPELTAGARLGLYPSFNQQDWKPLTKQLVEELHVSPDISRIVARAELYGRAAPLRVERGDWTSDAGLVVGGGLVRTVDDLEALQAEDDPVALSTQVELHPTLVLGLSAGLWWQFVGLRLDATRLHYTETVYGSTLENKRPVFLDLQISFQTP